jgi:prolyl-tRNA synthetase
MGSYGIGVERAMAAIVECHHDEELVGIPYRITVGSRDLANGLVELADRSSGTRKTLPLDAVVDSVLADIGKPATDHR